MNQIKKEIKKITGNKKLQVFFIILILLGIILIKAESSIIPQFNVCCEKTLKGAWCQNTLEKNCDLSNGLRTTPTSCEATSFCKKGCCIDSNEGICMRNTPERVCEKEGGVWDKDAQCNIPQCQLGCCILGDQASFVTLTRCKRLSNLYGLETNFKKDVKDELSCISLSSTNEEGACVFKTNEFDKDCKRTTKAGCKKGEFFKGRLCSDPKLGTRCGKTTKTTCIEGKDEVYFVDSCGNPANIYDASKVNNNRYWSEIIPKEKSCKLDEGLKNANLCGNCDFFKGSICHDGRATYGDHICKDLSCKVKINGKIVTRKNGESWCYYDGATGNGRDSVGSRHYRYICVNGEVTVEPCDDFRNKICIENKVKTSKGVFREAACRVNRWKDCVNQDNKKDCENKDKRDCYWIEGVHLLSAGKSDSNLKGGQKTPAGTPPSQTFTGGSTGGFQGGAKEPATGKTITGKSIFGGGDDKKDKDKETKTKTNLGLGGGICLPDVPPGFKFWEDGDAKSICGILTARCVVEYEKKLYGKKKCVKHCECLDKNYAPYANQLCTSMGDCGAYVNYVGDYTDDGIEVKYEGKRIEWQKYVGQGLIQSVMQRAEIGSNGGTPINNTLDLRQLLSKKIGEKND